MSTTRTIEEIKAELRDAEAAERAAAAERKASVKPVFKFTFTPYPDGGRWDKIYDQSCLFVRLNGELVNADEMLAAGHSQNDLDRQGGGMTYLFNRLSGMIVMSTGGGRLWLTHTESFAALSVWLINSPDGGDCTELVNHLIDEEAWAKAHPTSTVKHA